MSAPTYDNSYGFTNGWDTLQTTSSTTTATFSVNPNDLIVVFAGQSNFDPSIGAYNIPSISDDYNLTWQLVSDKSGTTQYCPLICWSTVNTYSIAITITITLTLIIPTSTTVRFGGKAHKFSYADGVGFITNGIDNTADGSYDLAISPFRSDSKIIFYILDWEAFSLSGRSYGTNNGFSPTEVDYQSVSNYTIAAALYHDTVAGNLSFLTSFNIKATLMAVEIKGVDSGIGSPGVLPPIQSSSIINNITQIDNISTLKI